MYTYDIIYRSQIPGQMRECKCLLLYRILYVRIGIGVYHVCSIKICRHAAFIMHFKQYYCIFLLRDTKTACVHGKYAQDRMRCERARINAVIYTIYVRIRTA